MKRFVSSLLFTCFLSSSHHVYADDAQAKKAVVQEHSPRENGMVSSLIYNIKKAVPSGFHGAHVAMSVANLKLVADQRYKVTLPVFGLVEANIFYSLLTLGIGSYGKFIETADSSRILRELLEYATVATVAGAGAYYTDGHSALTGVVLYTLAKILVAGDNSPSEYLIGEAHATEQK